MGYTTRFYGSVEVKPPLDADEIKYLKKFNNSRRMDRGNGPYFVDGSGFKGQNCDPDVIDYNSPPPGQPGLWCGWVPTDDGKSIKWDGWEKFYNAAEWMKYLIEHFLKPGALAIGKVPEIKGGHVVDGEIESQGEDADDRWLLKVVQNRVFVHHAKPVEYGDGKEI